MTQPTPHAIRAMNEALAVDAQLDRLVDLIGAHRTARLKQARQADTAKTSGLLARFETEYEILTLVEEVFCVDLDDARNDLADECARECGYDLRECDYVHNPEAADEWACHIADMRRDDRLLDGAA